MSLVYGSPSKKIPTHEIVKNRLIPIVYVSTPVVYGKNTKKVPTHYIYQSSDGVSILVPLHQANK